MKEVGVISIMGADKDNDKTVYHENLHPPIKDEEILHIIKNSPS